jgi:trimeric autotransporter adhesin
VTGGTPATGLITLNQIAPAGGTVVALSSSHPAIASVPASVTVPAGARSANFAATTFSSLTTEVDVLLFARSGGTTFNRPFYVRPPNRLPKLTSMTISPSPVTGGSNSGGTLTFSGPIPLGTWPALPDAIVRITSSDPDVAALFPGDDYVLAGSTSHTFRIFTRGLPATRTVTFTAYFDSTALSTC